MIFFLKNFLERIKNKNIVFLNEYELIEHISKIMNNSKIRYYLSHHTIKIR